MNFLISSSLVAIVIWLRALSWEKNSGLLLMLSLITYLTLGSIYILDYVLPLASLDAGKSRH
jgi:hypothetical protein